MKVSYEQLSVVSDARGFVLEPLVAGDFPGLKNAHIVVSMPGAVRGNHYHRSGKETIAVLGPALVRFREAGETRDVEIPTAQAFRFVFPPGVPHAIKNPGQAPNILMAFNTVPYDSRHPDIERAVLIET